MRLLSLVPVATLLAGCPSYENVDEACKDHGRGQSNATDAAIDVVQRVSCYRKYAGVDRGNLNKKVTDAVEAHAFYLSENGVGDSTWQFETSGETGFSGTDSYERLVESE